MLRHIYTKKDIPLKLSEYETTNTGRKILSKYSQQMPQSQTNIQTFSTQRKKLDTKTHIYKKVFHQNL